MNKIDFDNIKVFPIDNLLSFSNILEGKDFETSNLDNSFLYYINDLIEAFCLDKSKINLRHRINSLVIPMCLFDLLHLMAIAGKYVPIVDKDTNEVLISREEYLNYRKRMSGITSYNGGDYIFSDNLYFKELDPYLEKIDENNRNLEYQRYLIIYSLVNALNNINFNGKKLSVSVGFNSGGDIEIIETGSTARGTIIDANSTDFDFTIRFRGDNNLLFSEINAIKNALHNNLGGERVVHHVANDKLRIKGVNIDGIGFIDLDFSIIGQLDAYLSTDNAILEQLESMKSQDYDKYRLVVANIMFAKDYLKRNGAYKPSRSLNSYERAIGYGGLGGVGIENLIIQNGGSLIDSINSFLSVAEKHDDFIDFEKEFCLMDFGKNHIDVSKGRFPFNNFIMRNMRIEGYHNMRDIFRKLMDFIVIENYESGKNK